MTRDETSRLLQARRNLTDESFNVGTLDDWAEALAPWTYDQCRASLVVAARLHGRVTVAHLVERLPPTNRGRLFLVGSGYIDRDAERRPAERRPDPVAEIAKLRETLRKVRGR